MKKNGAFWWDPVQEQARENGELVYAMDQSQTPVLLDPNPARDGVASAGFCVGLAMRWIGLRFRGKDYAYDRKTRVANGAFREAVRDQNLSRSTVAPWPTRFETVLRQYGGPVDRGRSTQKPGTVSARLIEEAIAAGNGLYYFEMRGPGKAHALAVERERGGYHLFDGNEGHFFVKKPGRFRFFLTWFLNEAPGKYRTHYTVATWIAAVHR